MKTPPPEKPTLFLAGDGHGPPTLDQLIALTKCLTGRDPTPEEIEEARILLNAPTTTIKDNIQ